MAGKYSTKIKTVVMTAIKDLGLGFLFYKDPAVSGYDPLAAGEEDADSLAVMNGGSGIAAVEFDGNGYSRQALAYVDAGSGVIEDEANDLAKLVPDDFEFPTLDPAIDTAGVGGVIIYANHAGLDDTERYVVNVIPYATPQQPNGGAFPVNWPSSGAAYVV